MIVPLGQGETGEGDPTWSWVSLSRAVYSEDVGSGLLWFQLMLRKCSWYSLRMHKLQGAEPGATERKSRQVETLSSQHRGMVAHGVRVLHADSVHTGGWPILLRSGERGMWGL